MFYFMEISPGTTILSSFQLLKAIKERACRQIFRAASAIVEEARAEFLGDRSAPSLPPTNLLLRICNRARQSIRPPHPNSLEFQLDESFIPNDFLLFDLESNNCRSLVFATTKQLRCLARSREWFIDSTFYVVRPPFVQLMSIHAYRECNGVRKQFPLLFALMSGRRADDYRHVIR